MMYILGYECEYAYHTYQSQPHPLLPRRQMYIGFYEIPSIIKVIAFNRLVNSQSGNLLIYFKYNNETMSNLCYIFSLSFFIKNRIDVC